ncbi:Protein CBG23713 [Caenorhabditis briggsae]|uniref:Protein CBG23713 n=1 Tax=Caenorhabditis briggsae TaxID=6238 RepID=A8WJ49_CAEBR|nr:Protein CBG23713 [Caenorhabditis briggsae]CAP20491.1 Protein CBG23713 [Caenorhabditis briggsae]
MLLMTNSMLLPIGFSIERLYALKNAENYEREKVFLGPILVIILVALDFLFIGLIYFYENFTGPFISLILVRSTSAFQFNIYFYCLLGVQIFNLICNILILVFHSKKHKKSQQKTNTISFSVILFQQDKKRSSKVASNIAMVSTGQEGALNYENVTRNIWESAGN